MPPEHTHAFRLKTLGIKHAACTATAAPAGIPAWARPLGSHHLVLSPRSRHGVLLLLLLPGTTLRTSGEGAAGDVALFAPSTLGKALELSAHRQVARWKCHLLSRVLHTLRGCSPKLPALTCLN